MILVYDLFEKREFLKLTVMIEEEMNHARIRSKFEKVFRFVITAEQFS